MSSAVRILLLIPLGILFGGCAATLTLFILGANIPEFGAAFVSAFIAAWKAFFAAFAEVDDPNSVSRVTGRIWSLLMLILLAPVVITAIVAEAARLRGVLLHMVLTGALTILLPFAAGAPVRATTPEETRILACLFFTGVAAGLVYWLIAGRKGEPKPSAPAPTPQ